LEESAFLITGVGRVFKKEAGNHSFFNNSIKFQPVEKRILGDGNAWYEYGTFLVDEKQKPGYYVHVWMIEKQHAKLVTALYKWD
jgi:hypothetical protein